MASRSAECDVAVPSRRMDSAMGTMSAVARPKSGISVGETDRRNPLSPPAR